MPFRPICQTSSKTARSVAYALLAFASISCREQIEAETPTCPAGEYEFTAPLKPVETGLSDEALLDRFDHHVDSGAVAAIGVSLSESGRAFVATGLAGQLQCQTLAAELADAYSEPDLSHACECQSYNSTLEPSEM